MSVVTKPEPVTHEEGQPKTLETVLDLVELEKKRKTRLFYEVRVERKKDGIWTLIGKGISRDQTKLPSTDSTSNYDSTSD